MPWLYFPINLFHRAIKFKAVNKSGPKKYIREKVTFSAESVFTDVSEEQHTGCDRGWSTDTQSAGRSVTPAEVVIFLCIGAAVLTSF